MNWPFNDDDLRLVRECVVEQSVRLVFLHLLGDFGDKGGDLDRR